MNKKQTGGNATESEIRNKLFDLQSNQLGGNSLLSDIEESEFSENWVNKLSFMKNKQTGGGDATDSENRNKLFDLQSNQFGGNTENTEEIENQLKSLFTGSESQKSLQGGAKITGTKEYKIRGSNSNADDDSDDSDQEGGDYEDYDELSLSMEGGKKHHMGQNRDLPPGLVAHRELVEYIQKSMKLRR